MITRDMQQARKKIQFLSQTDYLTGLWNMRMFFALLHKEFDRSRRHGHHFCVMMLDADNLKRINDTHGHDCGSAMITMFADRIQQTVRRSDVIARFGGDEFVVLLPETKLARVGAAAERVRKAIEKSTLQVPGAEERVSVSIGIAAYPEHGGDVQEIIKKADIALYQSKRDGKNRATVYSG
jgi:diguanylate cyclase (GGDEF)-like protein